MKKIYDNFSDRLFMLSEKNKCLHLGALPKKGFYDLAKNGGAEKFLRGELPSFYLPHKLSADEKYYIGYPYSIARKNRMKIRAPLLFFPVIQDEDGNVWASGPAIPNRALFLLSDRSKTKRLLKILSDVEIDCAKQFTDILSECDPAFKIADKKGLIPFEDMPETAKKQKVLPVAVLGRFPVATELQEDYYRLKKGGLTTPCLEQLLTGKQRKIKQPVKKVFYTEKLDSSQEKALLSSGNNIVLFGPPGTGKSQTISAIVGNCLANDKKVLVVCQKQVALNVIYSRLENLQKKVFLSVDPKFEKDAFFKALTRSYEDACAFERNDDEKQLAKIEAEIKRRLAILESIDETLCKKTLYGLTLREMYALSCRHPETKQEADLINDFPKTGLLQENHEKITYDVTFIKNSRLTEKFIEYQNVFRKNELSFHVREADIKLLNEVRNCCGKAPGPFPFEKHPYGRMALTLFLENDWSVDKIASALTYSQRPTVSKLLLLSALPPFWFLAPFFIFSYQKRKKEIKNKLVSFFNEYEKYISPYAPLKKIFDKDGYATVVHAITNGADPMPKINETIDNYLTVRALNNLFSGLNDEIKSLLLFCYEHSEKTAESMNAILDKAVPIRIYHELLTYEPQAEKTLSDTQRYSETVKTILSLREKRVKLCRKIAADKCNENILDFKALFKEKSKEFLFQLGTPSRNIRQMYSDFGEYVMRLLPCLLTTPEVVSKILPLQKELFDVVIFDEASQLSVENAVPAVYRGKTMIVAGDDKQLPPPSTFSRKPTESDVEDIPESVIRARSLLDLAVTVFTPVKLTHHYRSEFRELIDFSNAHFYGEALIVAPNIRPHADPPIRYIKVRGKRIDRKNEREAEEITRLAEMYSLIGTVGIITFNTEQCDLIKEKIEKMTKKDPYFYCPGGICTRCPDSCMASCCCQAG